MDGWMNHVWMDGWMDVDRWMNGWMDGWVRVCGETRRRRVTRCNTHTHVSRVPSRVRCDTSPYVSLSLSCAPVQQQQPPTLHYTTKEEEEEVEVEVEEEREREVHMSLGLSLFSPDS